MFDEDPLFSRIDRRTDPTAWSAASARGVVASAHYRATAAGVAMLEAGGNAIDAAVAASLALGVCEPAGSGLGGMAMMLLYLAEPRRLVVVSGPCRAPRRATPQAVSDSKSRYRGHRAVATPGYPSVIAHVLGRYGRLSRQTVLAPAIRLAEDGFQWTAMQRELSITYRRVLRRGNAAELFLQPDTRPLAVGTRMRQPALARTLRRLSDAGFDDYYRGEIAEALVRGIELAGGFIGADDLAAMPPPTEAAPIVARFGAAEVHTVGPPGGGLALAQMCNMVTALGIDRLDPDRPDGLVALAGIIRRARQDRRDFRLKTGVSDLAGGTQLLDRGYADGAVDAIRKQLAEGGETSHLSVMDGDGNVVAMTQSIERSFGSASIVPELGFLLNGFLRTFKVKSRRHPHYLTPGAPGRSNASPTIAFRHGRPWAALGSTGSERIASGILQVLVRLRRQTPFEAVHAPRLHCTPEGRVLCEAERFSAAGLDALVRHGYALDPLEPYSFKAGGVQLAIRDDEVCIGVADPRRDGAAGICRSLASETRDIIRPSFPPAQT